jgi:1-phosphatidylinositol-3-phosphate 5-kinase
MKSLHWEISDFLHRTEKSILIEDESVKTGIQRQIIEMKDLLKMERNEYEVTQSGFSSLTRICQKM